jgi:hypothetical protein
MQNSKTSEEKKKHYFPFWVIAGNTHYPSGPASDYALRRNTFVCTRSSYVRQSKVNYQYLTLNH